MTFDLTEELISDIIFSMEDQGSFWYVDASDGTIASEEMMREVSREEGEEREDDFYSLPLWRSEDGYELMEEFVNHLHVPDAKRDLRQAISGGRGVFRNFKNVLKNYPEVERRWHLFKDEKMKHKVRLWYDNLRESWGLERLAETEDDESDTEDIVQDDFVFSEYEPLRDDEDIEGALNLVCSEIVPEFSFEHGGELNDALSFLMLRNARMSGERKKSGFVCRKPDGSLAGCMLTALCPSPSENTAEILYFFVERDSRGLGIGNALLSKSIRSLKKQGIKFIVIATTSVSGEMEPLLDKNGFNKIGPGYVADLIFF